MAGLSLSKDYIVRGVRAGQGVGFEKSRTFSMIVGLNLLVDLG